MGHRPAGSGLVDPLSGVAPAAEAPAAAEAAPPSLSRWGTIVSLLVLASLVGVLAWLHVTGNPLDAVERPEDALLLVVGRTLETEVGLERVSGWERRLHRAAGLESGRELDESLAWLDELAAVSLDPRIDVALVVLAAEAGHVARVSRATAEWQGRGETLALLADVVSAAYLQPPPDPAAVLDAYSIVAGDVPEGWFRDRLAMRLGRATGDAELLRAAGEDLAGRAASLLNRVRAINAVLLGLLAAGVIGLGGSVRRRLAGAPALRVARAPLPPPWRAGIGVAVLLRVGALAGLLSFGGGYAAHRLVDMDEAVADALLSALMAAPLFFLVPRRLLAPAGLGFRRAFGLVPVPGGRGALLRAVAMLLAAGIAVDVALTLVGDWRGWSSHWTEWFDAGLVWGGPGALAATLFGLVIAAPVMEELAFRGLLYGTLRARAGVGVSAAISAAAFALAHGYGPWGFASVFASGVLWAVAYERTGSLLPAIITHAATNLTTAVVLIVLLRA